MYNLKVSLKKLFAINPHGMAGQDGSNVLLLTLFILTPKSATVTMGEHDELKELSY